MEKFDFYLLKRSFLERETHLRGQGFLSYLENNGFVNDDSLVVSPEVLATAKELWPQRKEMEFFCVSESIVKRVAKRLQLGTKIEAFTSAVGIKPCEGCKKRKEILNGNY